MAYTVRRNRSKSKLVCLWEGLNMPYTMEDFRREIALEPHYSRPTRVRPDVFGGTEAVLKSMLRTKLKIGAAVLALVLVVAAKGAAMDTHPAPQVTAPVSAKGKSEPGQQGKK